MNESFPRTLYNWARVDSTKALLAPNKAMIHIQKTAPGPPMDMAVATPARLPVPTRLAKEMANAWKEETWWAFPLFWKVDLAVFLNSWVLRCNSSFYEAENDGLPPRTQLLFSTIKNTLHSLHNYHKLLIYNASQCNDKQNDMSLMSLIFQKWHQWHDKNKHITLGNTDIQRFMASVQWVQCVFESRKKEKASISASFSLFLLDLNQGPSD